MKKLTTEARIHGEESGDRIIGSSGDLKTRKTASTCHPERAGAHATVSRRIPMKLAAENAASGSSLDKLFRTCRIAGTVLREIFDENAYDRFLLRTHAARSVASYREFLREREAGIARKPRCC